MVRRFRNRCSRGTTVDRGDPAIYREALRRLDVGAERSLYIGDGGDDELTGAEAAGLRPLHAIWFRGGGAPASIPRTWPTVAACEDLLRVVAADKNGVDVSANPGTHP